MIVKFFFSLKNMWLFYFHNRPSPSKKVETIMTGGYCMSYSAQNWVETMLKSYWNKAQQKRIKIHHRMERALSN